MYYFHNIFQKWIFSLLVLILCYCCSIYSQAIKSEEIRQGDKFNFPNSKIGKSTLSFYIAPGFVSYTGNISSYFKTGDGGTMSLDYYSSNNMAYFLSLNGTSKGVKQDISVDEYRVWEKGSKADFLSYGLSVGYSFCNTINWRCTPFIGIVLSETKPEYRDMKENPYLKKYKIGPIPSPSLGLNISYRFIKKRGMELASSGGAGCFAISTRVTYVPFSVYNQGNPYSGGTVFLTLGVNFEFFGVN